MTYKSNQIASSLVFRLPAGSYEAVSLKDITIDPKFYEIIFEKDGKVATKRVWMVDPTRVQPKDNQTMQEAIEAAEKRSLTDITLVTGPLIKHEEFEADSINDYIKKAKMLSLKNKDAAKFNIVVEDDGQYLRVPRYDGIEEHIPGTPTNLRVKVKEVTEPETPSKIDDLV